jgi:hypothetical protein
METSIRTSFTMINGSSTNLLLIESADIGKFMRKR